MRLKSAIWVAAYLRRRHIDGTLAVVRRRGAEEAGAIFIKINRLDGTAELYGPAPQTAFEESPPGRSGVHRVFRSAARPRSRGGGLSGARDPFEFRPVDRRSRGSLRLTFARSCRAVTARRPRPSAGPAGRARHDPRRDARPRSPDRVPVRPAPAPDASSPIVCWRWRCAGWRRAATRPRASLHRRAWRDRTRESRTGRSPD